MKLTPVMDGKHKSVRGKVGALLAVGASPHGLWLIENVPWTTTCRLLRSRDGVRFEVTPLPPSVVSWSDASEAHASVLAVGDTAWICGRGGLLRASGDTLTPVTGIKPVDKSGHSRLWDVAQSPSGELWVASERRLVHSADGGKTWKSVPIKMPGAARVLWAVLPLAERVLAAGEGGIYALVGKSAAQVFSRADAVVRKLAASPTGTVVAVGDGGLVVSSKDGKRWTTLAGASGDLSCVAWCGDRFVIGGEAGALYTTDGTRKLERVKGPDEETHLTGLAPFHDGFFVAARRGFGSAVLLWSGGTLKAAGTRVPTPPPTRVPAPRPRDKVKARPLPPMQSLAWKDAVKRFPALERSVVDADELEDITLYRGAVAATSFPDHDGVSRRVVIVDGDLSLEGSLAVWAAQDDDTELVLLVNGALSARSVSVGNDARLLVTKDLVVDDVVVCGDGSWGRLEVGGALHTRALLVSGHNSVAVKGSINGLVVAQAGKAIVSSSTPQPVPAADVLRSGLCTDDHFDVRRVRKALKEGRAVLR